MEKAYRPERRPVDVGLTIPRDTFDFLIAMAVIANNETDDTSSEKITPGHIIGDAIDVYIDKRFNEDPNLTDKIVEALTK